MSTDVDAVTLPVPALKSFATILQGSVCEPTMGTGIRGIVTFALYTPMELVLVWTVFLGLIPLPKRRIQPISIYIENSGLIRY